MRLSQKHLRLRQLCELYFKVGNTLILSGHTDIRADDDYNYRLGLRRAKNVSNDLMKYIDKSKVDEVRVEHVI